MLSIDQNSNPLWDVPPKLHALKARGLAVRHFIEDIDVAFTALGSLPDANNMRLARERYHRGGAADWGAAMFYSSFLGRLPVDIRQWEPMLGLALDAVARRLGRSLDEMYARYSPGDNWQLIGSSYVGDRRHHRIVGDLSVGEVAPHARQLLQIAWNDCMERFPQRCAQQRIGEWFESQTRRLQGRLDELAARPLTELYAAWLGECVNDVPLALTSGLFALGAPGQEVLEAFVRDYHAAADAYNSVVGAAAGLRPLDTAAGELPMFATTRYRGHRVRVGVRLSGGKLVIGEREFALAPGARLPLDALRSAGIEALAGKAVVLILQARCIAPLAVPYRGSFYMPAAHRLQRLMQQRKLLPQPCHPLYRVRLGLLDHLRGLDTIVRLPKHLAGELGHELPARTIGERWRDVSASARRRLDGFRSPAARRAWLEQARPAESAELAALDARRRQLASRNEKDPELRQIWKRIKPLENSMLESLLESVADDWQTADLDYWDSRGALLPWCLALGGESFYRKVVASARVYQEPPDEGA
jgi:hypothetical protein